MKQNWPTAHIEMYSDGRTHLTFDSTRPYAEKIAEKVKETVKDALGDKLQPGRAFRITIKKVTFFRRSIEFDYERVR